MGAHVDWIGSMDDEDFLEMPSQDTTKELLADHLVGSILKGDPEGSAQLCAISGGAHRHTKLTCAAGGECRIHVHPRNEDDTRLGVANQIDWTDGKKRKRGAAMTVSQIFADGKGEDHFCDGCGQFFHCAACKGTHILPGGVCRPASRKSACKRVKWTLDQLKAASRVRDQIMRVRWCASYALTVSVNATDSQAQGVKAENGRPLRQQRR